MHACCYIVRHSLLPLRFRVVVVVLLHSVAAAGVHQPMKIEPPLKFYKLLPPAGRRCRGTIASGIPVGWAARLNCCGKPAGGLLGSWGPSCLLVACLFCHVRAMQNPGSPRAHGRDRECSLVPTGFQWRKGLWPSPCLVVPRSFGAAGIKQTAKQRRINCP